MASLEVIIVSWNVRELLRRCIASVHASLAGSGLSYRIVVVDNASADGTAAAVRAEHPEVELLEAGRNLGFAGGNNLALRRALGAGRPDPDFFFLLNPDTEVVGDAIPRLARYLEQHPDVAAVGPRLRYPDGSVQPSRRRFPTAGVFFWESTPLEWRWPGNPWARSYRLAARPDDAEQDVGWLVGAALMVRRDAVERAGLMDAGFALYSEELEWQRRIRQLARSASGAGDGAPPGPHRIVYLPDAEVVHHEGKSSEQEPGRRLALFHRSRLRYVQLVHGRRLAQAVRRFLILAYGAELAVESAKWIAGHRRPLRAARVASYLGLIRSLTAPVERG